MLTGRSLPWSSTPQAVRASRQRTRARSTSPLWRSPGPAGPSPFSPKPAPGVVVLSSPVVPPPPLWSSSAHREFCGALPLPQVVLLRIYRKPSSRPPEPPEDARLAADPCPTPPPPRRWRSVMISWTPRHVRIRFRRSPNHGSLYVGGASASTRCWIDRGRRHGRGWKAGCAASKGSIRRRHQEDLPH